MPLRCAAARRRCVAHRAAGNHSCGRSGDGAYSGCLSAERTHGRTDEGSAHGARAGVRPSRVWVGRAGGEGKANRLVTNTRFTGAILPAPAPGCLALQWETRSLGTPWASPVSRVRAEASEPHRNCRCRASTSGVWLFKPDIGARVQLQVLVRPGRRSAMSHEACLPVPAGSQSHMAQISVETLIFLLSAAPRLTTCCVARWRPLPVLVGEQVELGIERYGERAFADAALRRGRAARPRPCRCRAGGWLSGSSRTDRARPAPAHRRG